MENHPLKQLESFGQSVWLDYLSRDLLSSGELRRLMDDDGLTGVTSNPAIFEKAINGSEIYDPLIQDLASRGKDVDAIYRELTVEDVTDAADQLAPVHERTGGRDGFVSLEVNPHLAHDSEGSLNEARELWQRLGRKNVMIKVPATKAGLPVIRRLIAEGINVNVTLLFDVGRYHQVLEAYLAGLEERLRDGKPVDHVASVASFFLSRIDSLVDPMLANIENKRNMLVPEQGSVAIASARLAYRHFQDVTADQPFRRLAEQGAQPQRLLWASTSTKNPAYPDTKYVEALIGPDTVNTMPMETIVAYRDHGEPAERITEHLREARAVMSQLQEAGIDIKEVAEQLEHEGVQKFTEPHDKLFAALEKKRREAA